MSKWYAGMNAFDLVDVFTKLESKISKNIHDEYVAESIYADFEQKFKEIVPVIVDVKTEYWAYRDKNDVYNTWDNCLERIKLMRLEVREMLGYN